MKKLFLTVLLVLVAGSTAVAHATERSVTVLLVGGPSTDVLDIKLSQDGRSYLVDASAPLEAGGGICAKPEESVHQLICEAMPIAGFEVNAGGGEDYVIISPKILIPTTLRGGPGRDRLRGGGGADKLVGGSGNDSLLGEGGEDWLFGGPGEDMLWGGPGDDRLVGGPGSDYLNGGQGTDDTKVGPRDQSGPQPLPRPPS
jgi:Ca2+-binding RTX toxin-like protein